MHKTVLFCYSICDAHLYIYISLLLSLAPTVFASDCPPLPSLLNLGQITGVQLDCVTDWASRIGLWEWFWFFPWNILFVFWSRTQLIQLNDINAEVHSTTFDSTFHGKVEHEERSHWSFMPAETMKQKKARNQRLSVGKLLSWKPAFITPVCMKRVVKKKEDREARREYWLVSKLDT